MVLDSLFLGRVGGFGGGVGVGGFEFDLNVGVGGSHGEEVVIAFADEVGVLEGGDVGPVFAGGEVGDGGGAVGVEGGLVGSVVQRCGEVVGFCRR